MNRDNLRIKEPCHADWSEMDGGGEKRFCGSCSKNVHDLSAMTEPEAKQVLKEVEKPCVRYTCNSDGTIRFKPTRRVFLSQAGLVAGGLMVGLPAAASVVPAPSVGDSCSKSLFDRISDAFWGMFEDESEPMMGEMMIEMGDVGEPVELMDNIAESPPEPPPEPVPEELEVMQGEPMIEMPPQQMMGRIAIPATEIPAAE